jgi:hypothetical protein
VRKVDFVIGMAVILLAGFIMILAVVDALGF